MKVWEFLIQKEGDRSWLPLESPSVEILEGRYRMVARSSRINADVDVRITHQGDGESAERRVQRRSGRTNKDGLIVIFPFTRLEPGTWDLRCTGDLMADLLGDSWQYAVQLQVLPQELDALPDWEPDWQEAVTAAEGIGLDDAEAAPALEPAPSAPAAAIEPEEPVESSPSAEPIAAPDVQAADVDPSHLAPPSPQPVAASAAPAVALRIALEQDNYVIQEDQPLTLRGQVEALEGLPAGLVLTQLQVRLYDPQTSRVLTEIQQGLQEQDFNTQSSQGQNGQDHQGSNGQGLPICCEVGLPDHYHTHLLLGELTLYGQFSEQPPVAIATRNFSVTTDLRELLEALANDSEIDRLPAPGGLNATEAAEPNTAFLNLLDQTQSSLQIQPADATPLPPQLRPTDPDKPRIQSPQLPSFAEATAEPAAVPPDAPAAERAAEITETIAETNFATATAPDAAPEAPLAADIPAAVRIDLPPVEENSAAAAAPMVEPLPLPHAPTAGDDVLDWVDPRPTPIWRQVIEDKADLPQSPEAMAFRALNLSDRFWMRLCALATDREFARSGDFPMETGSPNALHGGTKPVGSGATAQHTVGLDADLTAQEVVAEDVLAEAPRNQQSSGLDLMVLVLPATEPIPVPELDVPAVELVSGQSISVRVKLPNLPYRIFVRLWLQDRQSRSMLDGPYWVTNFQPDGRGSLVAQRALTLPHGCLEAQFEAIAVEVTTQRESDKATLNRSVVPPNLPSLTLDELDL